MKNFMNSDCNHIFESNCTSRNKYTDFQQNYPYTQMSENDTLCLPNRKGCIKKITNVSVDISIGSYKIIPTPMGKSLAVDAIKHITITYVDKNYNSLVCTTFKVPFCFSISINKICEKFKSICVSVENICVTVLNQHSFSISMIVFAYPVFQQKKKSSVCNNDSFYVNSSNCNVKSNKTPDNCSNLNCAKSSTTCRYGSSTKNSNSSSNNKCNTCTCNNCKCSNVNNLITIILLFLLLNFARINLCRHC